MAQDYQHGILQDAWIRSRNVDHARAGVVTMGRNCSSQANTICSLTVLIAVTAGEVLATAMTQSNTRMTLTTL